MSRMERDSLETWRERVVLRLLSIGLTALLLIALVSWVESWEQDRDARASRFGAGGGLMGSLALGSWRPPPELAIRATPAAAPFGEAADEREHVRHCYVVERVSLRGDQLIHAEERVCFSQARR